MNYRIFYDSESCGQFRPNRCIEVQAVDVRHAIGKLAKQMEREGETLHRVLAASPTGEIKKRVNE